MLGCRSHRDFAARVNALISIIRALSLLFIALTLLPFIRSPAWWIRVWDYPRLQLATVLGVLLLANVILLYVSPEGTTLSAVSLTIATALACAWQAHSIWPYTPAHTVQSLPARAPDIESGLAVIVTNVLQHNRNSAGLVEIVSDMQPDILIAIETDAWWDEQLAVLDATFPHNVRIPLENTYGMHVFSQLELRDVCVREIVSPGIPSVRATVRLRSGEECELYAVHPEPPLPRVDAAKRDAELLLVAREVRQRRRPTLVAGDLNDVAWSHTTRLFQRISGLLDPRVGRGLFATFNAKHRLVRWPLDHLFHDRSFRLLEMKVLRGYGSDHFPIYASLVHDPAAVKRTREPRADAQDQADATEKITEGVATEHERRAFGWRPG